MSARSYRLKAKESPGEGTRRIALGRCEKAIEQLNRAGDGDNSAASIHAARKDLKKLRGVVRLVRAELGLDLYREERRRYRDAGRLLAPSRDAEVKVETLKALSEHFDDDLPADLVAGWLAALQRERDEIAEGVSNEQGRSHIAEAKAAIEAGREEIARWPLHDDSWKLVGAGLADSYRSGRRAMKRARAEPAAENVHEWRKRTKDLWYQLLILREAWHPVLGETAAQAHKLTDLLGVHHDLALLAGDLANRELSGDRDAAKGTIERRQRELLDSACEIGTRLYAEKPKAFGKRIEAYWQAWRSSWTKEAGSSLDLPADSS